MVQFQNIEIDINTVLFVINCIGRSEAELYGYPDFS